MIESFNISGIDSPKITSLTKPLINSEIFKAAEVNKTLSDKELAHIYDVHGQGLLFQGKDEEQSKYAKLVYDKYYPGTFAGAVCGIRYANYLSGQGKSDEAFAMLKKIVSENPTNNDYTCITGNMGMADIKIQNKDYKEALRLVEAAIQRTSPFANGQHYSWHQAALDRKKSLEEIIRGTSSIK